MSIPTIIPQSQAEVSSSAHTYYGKKLSEYHADDQRILLELTAAKLGRQYYENMWREWDYAFQTIVHEFSVQRQFNPNLAPEVQVRSLFSNKKMSDYRLPVEFAVIIRQVADEMANLPKTRWVSLARSRKERVGRGQIFNYLDQWNYYETDGDIENFKTLLGKAIFGTAVEYVYHEYFTYKDHEPEKIVDGNLTYKEVNRVISNVRFKNIDLRHIFFDVNGTDIREKEHCFLVTNLGKATAERIFADAKFWDLDGCQEMTFTECYVSLGEARLNQQRKGYQLLRYFNAPRNEMVYFLNGKRINKQRMYLPVPALPNQMPMLPFAVFYDHPAHKEFYGIGKCQILKPFREVKNKTRNAFFDTAKKMAFNTLVIDPMSDFDEETYEFGQPFIRANPDEVRPLPTSGNLEPLVTMDNKTDQDIIWSTGINFQDTAAGLASETATKSAIRKESQVKIVELGLKYNTFDGFKRRNILRKQLLRLHYRSGVVQTEVGKDPQPLTIKTRGVQLLRGRGKKNQFKIHEEKTYGFGLFDITAEDLKHDVDLVLEVGNIAATRELQKARQQEGVEMLLRMPSDPETGKPAFNIGETVKWVVEWAELPQEILPSEAGMNLADMDPKEIVSQLPLIDKPPTYEDLAGTGAEQPVDGQTAPGLTGGGPPMPGAGQGEMPMPGSGAN